MSSLCDLFGELSDVAKCACLSHLSDCCDEGRSIFHLSVVVNVVSTHQHAKQSFCAASKLSWKLEEVGEQQNEPGCRCQQLFFLPQFPIEIVSYLKRSLKGVDITEPRKFCNNSFYANLPCPDPNQYFLSPATIRASFESTFSAEAASVFFFYCSYSSQHVWQLNPTDRRTDGHTSRHAQLKFYLRIYLAHVATSLPL